MERFLKTMAGLSSEPLPPVAEQHAGPAFPQSYNSALGRPASYINFPTNVHVFISKLAQNGLVYRPEIKAVVCYFCKTRIGVEELKESSVAFNKLHQERSSDCSLMWGTSKYQPKTDIEDDSQSGVDIPPLSPPQPKTDIEGDGHSEVEIPAAAPPSPLGQSRVEITYADLSIFTGKPKHADMAILSDRIATFKGKWNHTQTPLMLAEAGMYYAGYADCARCFFCSGGLKTWYPPDNPWIEHARWFPKCNYLGLTKGPLFVDIVQRMNKNKEDITLEKVQAELQSKASGRKKVGADRTPAFAVVNSNNQKDWDPELVCKICMEFDCDVVFLPCGHLVACVSCAIVLKNCPLCRRQITGSVRARMDYD